MPRRQRMLTGELDAQVRRSRSATKARANSIASTGDSLASPNSRYQGPARRQSRGVRIERTLTRPSAKRADARRPRAAVQLEHLL